MVFVAFMLYAFSVCSGLYIVTLVEDREKRLRHVLKVVGLRSSSYFCGNLIADLLLFFISSVIFVVMLYILGLSYLYKDWARVLGIITSFGFALINLTYLVSFIFKDATYAFNKIGTWFLVIGLFLPIVMFILFGIINSLAIASMDNYIIWMHILLIDPFWSLA